MPDTMEAGATEPRKKRRATPNAVLREDSIHRITEAAFRLFVTRGYAATTLQQIADDVGMTKGAIFFYFQSKENLLLHLLGVAEQSIVTSFAHQAEASTTSAVERLVAFFHHGARQGLERPYELLCLIQISIEFSGSETEIGRRVSAIYDKIYGLLARIVEDGQRAGELTGAIKPVEFVAMVVAMHDGMMLEWHRRGGRIDGRLLVQAVRMTVLNGVLAQERG
ncbi:MAG: hypothetical protein ABS76_00685 [Pelagibacterium sp. SCN 64-44]|nr:MAG: hypothetical protein ABS76_00685 [Pelagibacterium sp. SCN 64-44]